MATTTSPSAKPSAMETARRAPYGAESQEVSSDHARRSPASHAQTKAPTVSGPYTTNASVVIRAGDGKVEQDVSKWLCDGNATEARI